MPAVSLALWGGLFADDPGRRDREQQWRRDRVLHHLVDDLGIDPTVASSVWDHAVASLRGAWLDEHHSMGMARALGEGLAHQGLRPRDGFDELVADLETRAFDDPPELLPGALEALEALAAEWPVGILCDVRVTPAPVLREMLDQAGIGHTLDAAVFSDEVGAARPSRTPFRIIAHELGIPLVELVHAGPSEGRDVLGAHGAGASAVRLGEPPTAAEAVAESLRDLPDAVRQVVAEW